MRDGLLDMLKRVRGKPLPDPEHQHELIALLQGSSVMRVPQPWRHCRLCRFLYLLELLPPLRSLLPRPAEMRPLATNMVLCSRISVMAAMVACKSS